MRKACAVLALICVCVSVSLAQSPPAGPLAPFEPDDHTLLLYHFDEGQGLTTKDASRYGYDGEVRGAQWEDGRFGKALSFDGKDDSVYRQLTPAIQNLRQITVECWFNQESTDGRQFLIGKDVTFHYDFSGGTSTSMSLYNKGGGVVNEQGLRHQHLGAGVGSVRPGRWHHNAVTYDGHSLSFFLDGVLRHRVEAARDFLLGVEARGLWVGCYVGTDFWYSGKMDEVRVSDCVRYDPENKLRVGGKVFEMPVRARPAKAVRTPRKTGQAALALGLKKLYGADAAGWVYLKPPGARAAIVGQYALRGLEPGAETKLELDVSDELLGDGTYILGLEPTDMGATIALTSAALTAGGREPARWAGEARSRRTFGPPVIAPLQMGAQAAGAAKPGRLLLLPGAVDRLTGELEVDDEDKSAPPCLVGDGWAEYWVHVPAETTYRVYLRYATAALRPCDIVIDGTDLNAYDMCALNRTERSRPRDALWEYQGTTTLTPGVHWIRLQDVLPDIVGLRLDPTPPVTPTPVPWERYAVPDGGLLTRPGAWGVRALIGQPRECRIGVEEVAGKPALRIAAAFHNTDTTDLFGGDAARLTLRGTWDLEPFGRFTCGFQGNGAGHVISLWAVDAKGDEKLLWRARDAEPGMKSISVPVSFEGNDVFDPGHVVALCVELDEGNVNADRVNQFSGTIVAPAFERRDVIAAPADYSAVVARARQTLAAALKSLAGSGQPLLSPGFHPWTRPIVPEEHPLFATTTPAPVTRKTLGYDLHATGARGIGPNTLDEFHKLYDFGDVCWPHIGICPLRANFKTDEDYRKALVDFEQQLVAVRDRGLLLFDIWGYVPYHPQFPHTIAPEHHEILMRVFGDRFLGYDNGEQDGRYIGAYADKGKATNRREGWDDFVAWDEHVCNDSASYMNATGSLNFSHYYGERGCRLLGLETAQGLPSDTLMFAFLRGAGKQYGRLLYQATSIWNRYGYNMYHARKTDGANGYGFGPAKGCSLSLHKRLFFAGYLGGHSICGTETSQFTADRLENGAPELSPLGRQHLEIMDWVRQHPERGVQYTPVAFMLDFYNGWNMPRHLYRGDRYKIWGKFPYEKGDYLIDGVFRMVWPGYEDCSYLRNERGFICPTPYGDIFDVLTNRCHADILKQYTAIMLLGDVETSPEVVARLSQYVAAGGDLVLDARHARSFPESLTGVTLGAEGKGVLSHLPATGQTFQEQPYTYTVMSATRAQTLLVNEQGHPLLTVTAAGKGRVVVAAADYWMTDALKYQVPEIVNMEPPYRMLTGLRVVLDRYFGSFGPVQIEPAGLTIQTCCYENDSKRLLVGLTNNDLFADWKGRVRVRGAEVKSAHELRADSKLATGNGIDLAVPAGDVATIDVRLQ